MVSITDRIIENAIKDGQFAITGEIGGSLPSNVHMLLQYLHKKLPAKRAVQIYLNSGGGDVTSGLAIYDAITAVGKKRPIHIYAQGYCMSMALVVLQAATKRIAYPNAAFMLHDIQNVFGGSLTKTENDFKHVKTTQDKLDQILAERSGINAQKLRKALSGVEWYFDPPQAKKFNLIDSIVGG